MAKSSASRTMRSGTCADANDLERVAVCGLARAVTRELIVIGPRADRVGFGEVATDLRTSHYAAIAGHCLIGHRPPTEATGLNAACRAHFDSTLGIIKYTLHLLGDSAGVLRRN